MLNQCISSTEIDLSPPPTQTVKDVFPKVLNFVPGKAEVNQRNKEQRLRQRGRKEMFLNS